MHIISLPNALLFLLLVIASTAYPALAMVTTPDEDGHRTYANCVKGDPDFIPRSDYYPAAGKFLFDCIITPRPEVFPKLLDLASRDPNFPDCKVYGSSGRANVAVCVNGYGNPGEKEVELLNKAFPNCWYAAGAWQKMMRACPDGEMVEAIRPYPEMGMLLRIYRNRDRP